MEAAAEDILQAVMEVLAEVGLTGVLPTGVGVQALLDKVVAGELDLITHPLTEVLVAAVEKMDLAVMLEVLQEAMEGPVQPIRGLAVPEH